MLNKFSRSSAPILPRPAKLLVVPLMMVEYTLKKFLQNSAVQTQDITQKDTASGVARKKAKDYANKTGTLPPHFC